MFIPERQREALMRLTMCARDECMMCIYQPKDDRCKDIATTAMHILANALRVDEADTPQTNDKDTNVLNKSQTDCAWMYDSRRDYEYDKALDEMERNFVEFEEYDDGEQETDTTDI